jgi:ribose transport system ATP-binding protein
VQTLPVWQNVTLPWTRRFSSRGFLRLSEERRAAARNTSRVGVKMPGIGAGMTQLSGGNQQKAIFARWVGKPAPRVLLLDEPTHGVDIRSKGQIYEVIRQLASEGTGVLLVSSELEEIEALCDRALLLHRGELTTELRGEDISKEIILQGLLTGQEEKAAHNES